ncbi:MAG: chemotaxis protein CheA [Lachnospiraceae bacterium]|nr:chemotaxis protein CheA [Lachnospiraceae bacterium]
MAEDFNTDSMLDMYLFENRQLLENLDGIVLEKQNADAFDEDDVNSIFRVMHTIKGSSGIMMFDNITHVSHKLEDIFYYIRESQPEHLDHKELVSIVLDVSGFITNEFDKIEDGDDPDGDNSELMKVMDKFLEDMKNHIESLGEALPEENVYVAPSQFYIAPMATEQSHFYKILIRYREDTMMSNIRAYNTVYALKDVAEDLLYMPEDILGDEKSADIILEEGFAMLLQTQSSKDEIHKLVDNCPDIVSIEIDECDASTFALGFNAKSEEPTQIDLDSSVEEIQARARKEIESTGNEKKKDEVEAGDYVVKEKTPGRKQTLAKHQKKEKQQKQSFISVNVAKMDALMDLVGELVIAQSGVLQNPDLQVPGLELSNFQKAARQMMKFSSELQDVIMSMRLMPLTNTFQKMNRIVFDVSRKLGKEIELEIIGEETEVDKKIIENISDPLMHLIRNSVDHGIEMPEDRVAAGKPAKGKITIEAMNESGKVFIIVKDDGKGLDSDAIYQKAKKNELIPDGKHRSDFTDKELYQYITYPGFSTKEKVTEYSGRGVGMDVVVKNIQSIGGRLEIDSKKGAGSTMTLKIPLTLAIIEGIVLKLGTSMFVVETSNIQEFIKRKDCQLVKEPNGEEYAVVRDEYYPVVRLEKKYHLDVSDEDNGIVVILEHEGQRIATFVEKLVGQQEIVVKPIPSYVPKVDGLSGCTQLGDGSIALILDVAGLKS